ncbi:MAG: polyamine ABC transporter ATP-binding protein [Bacteroidales bacterium]|nr:polyamine ABC transporter ATP-binding protein [Bacteroidales bacterium]
MRGKDTIINIEGLSQSYGDKQVLHDINLYVRRGEFVTLLGPSGCGKTTLLRLIAGFLQPTEGRILLEGRDISGIPPYRRPLNTVFQRYALFPHLDVYDNVAFGLKLQKVPEDEIEKRVKRVLKLVSMSDYEDRDVNSLSGGQQQRVAIARALINQPRVLLLDEPLAALDLKMRKDMQIELKEMHKKLGITFIYVTHDQEEALTLSDTIVVMNEGIIQQIGTPIDIYNEPVNAFVADFIGDSNILNGKMFRDRRVAFIKHEFDCVDEGFGENVSVDVVVRPEDIYFTTDPAKCQFTAKVNSCTFKGVHYEMWVDTDTGYELMIQDYDPYPVGSEVMLYIDPDDIQVMKKERRFNSYDARVTGEGKVMFLDTEFACHTEGFNIGDQVRADIRFERVDLLDHEEGADLTGNVVFILYKGDHYHLTVKIAGGGHIWVDTHDIWDKGDFVGIRILPEDIKLSKALSGDE